MSGVDFVFNIARGTIRSRIAAGQTFQALLLRTTNLEADATLRDYDTVTALLAGTSDECSAGSYARVALTGLGASVTDASDIAEADSADIAWGALTGGQTVAKVVIYSTTDDVPLTAHSYDETCDGTALTSTVANFWRSS